MEFERHELPQPFYGSVNVYRVGNTLVDTGHVAATCAEQLREAVLSGPLQGVERVVLTHPHIDHLGGSQIIPELADLPHVVYEGVPEVVHGFDDYLRQVHDEIRTMGSGLSVDLDVVVETYFPTGEYTESGVDIERVVSDGDTLTVGEHTCEVVHTPGHSAQHMALVPADSETVFSADLVSRNGHFMFGPLHADIRAYQDSLRRLRDLQAGRLLPGHGEVIDAPAARIDDALQKAEQSATAICRAVDAVDGRVPARRLARDVFGANDRTVSFLTFVVCAYLDYLAEKGELTVRNEADGVFAVSA